MPDPTATWIDAAFPLQGSSLPLDHGYALFSALSRILPVLHEQEAWGVHPVHGRRVGPDVLGLIGTSLLKVRMPAAEIAQVLPLAGASLDVRGHTVSLGVPRLYPLVPAATIKARLVTIKGFHEEPDAFADALRRQLGQIEGLGQDPERVEVTIGRRRIVQVGSHKVVGFAVQLTGLEAPGSLAIQRQGLGGRRHMGAGIFVPPGSRHSAP